MKIITDITPIIQKKEEKIKLAAYCRVSSNSEDQLHSYAAQIRYYSEYAKENPEYELVDIYADEGITGTEMKKRDELHRLLRDSQKGKINRIIAKSVSRFARNTEELLVTLRMLKDLGVSVYFEEQGIDTEKLNAEMFVTIPGMVAQQESMTISGNLRWGIHKRMKMGSYVTPKAPYGYLLVNGELIINKVEATAVRRIYDLYLQGEGMCAIAETLNRERVRKRNGRLWCRKAIRYILTNEKYIGDALFQKKYTTETLPFRQKVNHGEKPQYYVENYNDPIVDKDTYQKAQEMLAQKQREQREPITYPLSGKMRCPDCGKLFRRIVIRGKVYWMCSRLASDNGKCKSRRVKEEMVYEAFTLMSYKLKSKREELLELFIRRFEFVQSQVGGGREKIRSIDKKIADLSAKNIVVAKLHTSGLLSVSDYTAQTAELANQLRTLRQERKEILDEDENDALLDDIQNLNETIKEYQPKGGFDEELFEQIVEKIVVKDNAELEFELLGGIRLKETIKEKGRCKTA